MRSQVGWWLVHMATPYSPASIILSWSYFHVCRHVLPIVACSFRGCRKQPRRNFFDHLRRTMGSTYLRRTSFHPLTLLLTQALVRTSVEMLEPVIDHTTIGDKPVEIWKFATLQTLEAGAFLCRQQTHDRSLYVVQEGQLTCYADLPDGTRHRLQKVSRGTFINDECLFVDLPVAYNVKVWAHCLCVHCLCALASSTFVGLRGVSRFALIYPLNERG